MPGLNGSPRGALAAALMIFLTPAASAQERLADAPIVYLRATTSVSARVDEYVARHARPVQLSAAAMDQLSAMTPDEVITQVCGSVREGYYAAFLAANPGLALARGRVIGDAAHTLVLPACLYAGRVDAEGLPQEIGAEALAGASRRSNLIVSAVRGVGSLLTGNSTLYASAVVALAPLDVSSEEFLEGVAAAARQDEDVRVQPLPLGRIVVSLADANCETSRAVFDPAFFRENYRFARLRARAQGREEHGRAHVYVVDNGFFGARNVDWEHAFEDSPFPPYLFRPSPLTVVEGELAPGRGAPLNYANPDLSPNPISGHGTHVAGLAIGGPQFAELRDLYDNDISPWMSVTILNVGDGGETIEPSTQSDLQNALEFGPSQQRIVNLSLSFDGAALEDMGSLYVRLFRTDALFVVAAGNSAPDAQRDVSSMATYPAAFGGLVTPNVMTVAALDARDRLAEFSNFGARGVDIGAPGCRVPSWLDNSGAVTPLSGTSAAAPAVTFAAALVSSLSSELDARAVKARLIAGGDLLETETGARLAYRIKLNLLKPLFPFDDLIAFSDAPAVFFGGSVLRLEGVRCADSPRPIALRDLWALKREGEHFWAYRGRTTQAVSEPCLASVDANARLVFREEFRVSEGAPPASTRNGDVSIGLDQLGEIVMRDPPREPSH
ncbi:MAG: S8 family serine peptidase [Hyphomonadaceae bacterium]|nr:S8 family serine peptidase [Hyphomonadaceae bacterium]